MLIRIATAPLPKTHLINNESHQNFRGELRLSLALGQKAKQRHHLLFGAHQAICDDMGAAVLRGSHIQQQRVPEGLEQPEGWEHGQH